MNRKRILWLVSWYPNRYDKFNGDFIQRHAQAASIDNDIYVIHLQETNDIQNTEVETTKHPGLTEHIIYYKEGVGFIQKVQKQFRYFSIYKKAINRYIQDYGIPHCVHVHVPWKAGLLALWLKKRYNLDFILTEHWTIYSSLLPGNFREQSFFFKNQVKKVLRTAKTLTVVSEALGKTINEMVLKRTYQVLPNVVNTDVFKYADMKGTLFTYLHVSNMVSFKNVDVILNSFAQLISDGIINAQLIFVGDKDEKYEKFAEKLGLLNSCIFFRGELSYREVCLEMQKAHCLVMMSTYETFSCVVAEALCCGLPVIATEVGIVPEIIHKNNGIIVKSQDALLAAMKEIYYNSNLYDSRRISEDARVLFNYEVIGKQFDLLYEENKVI